MEDECKELLSIANNWLKAGFFESAYEKVFESIECAIDKSESLKEEICEEIEVMYRRQADIYTDQRDWYSCGQVLFDAGRLSLYCGKFKKSAEFFIDAADIFSNSARLHRQVASSYIFGAAILSTIEKQKRKVKDFFSAAAKKLEWEVERYKLLRDMEQLGQTYDDFALIYMLMNDFNKVIENLELAAGYYSKINDPDFYKIAALRYSFISSIYKHILEKVGWSKYNRLAFNYFEKGGDHIASSIELLRMNLYLTEDEDILKDITEAARKIGETGSYYASSSLMLNTLAVYLKDEKKSMSEEFFSLLIDSLNKANDIKLLEEIKTFYILKNLKPLPIDYLGKYKKTDGVWIRIW